MGHIGLTPQSIHQFGGFKIQGKTPEAAARLLDDARALEKAGAFSVVMETVPTPLAALVTREISIPTIGIGAGIGCDGQVQVINDIMSNAIGEYYEEVKAGKFPTEANSFSMDESALAGLTK